MKEILLFLALILVFACTQPKNEKHFISDKNYLDTVLQDFEKIKKLASNRNAQLFDVFNENLSLEEIEALKFLYAYMPLNDLADYNGTFFLENIRLALKTRETTKWGSAIPENIFRHFVLPYRINNENLDSSRQVFYRELSVRLKGMGLKEAILEVNHWCHEKVNYQGTDERTIAPLSAIKSTYGRCGEESTFTVTAMRAAGIPARQCYTPRWAHTDDNHAWVEVWLDGNWQYLGACEPLPDLNMGWFSAPALRAMLVKTNVFGKYSGKEETMRSEDKYTKINVLKNYAPTKKIFVKVLDADNSIATNATVEFQLYNYAEFYPIGKKKTDENGISSMLTGLGDLLVWAYQDNAFAYQKITVEETDTLVLKLQNGKMEQSSESYDIVPPIEKQPKATSEEGIEHNNIRLAYEDSLRNAFAATFIKKHEAYTLALELNLDSLKVWDYLSQSKGNYPEIVEYLEQAVKTNPTYALELLGQIANKDLRDGSSNILLSHLNNSTNFTDGLENVNKDLFAKYILNPRIEYEKIVPYKAFLQKAFGKAFISKTKQDINTLSNWIKTEISIYDDENYYRVPITSIGVYELSLADKKSRNQFFVATCRAFGIPARIEQANKTPQYFKGEWIDVKFDKEEIAEIVAKGQIKLINAAENNTDIKYRTHYAITKFKDGKYHTLDYGWGTKFEEMPEFLELESGKYLLLTGNRQSDGSVLTNMDFFNVEANQKTELLVKLRSKAGNIEAIAETSIPKQLMDIKGNTIEFDANKSNIIAFLDPNAEPTKHTLLDIGDIKTAFESLESEIYLFVNNKNFDSELYPLPTTAKYVFDKDAQLLSAISDQMNKDFKDFPVFMIVKENKVYFLSTGYTIGIGEQIIKLIRKQEAESLKKEAKTCKIG